MVEILTRPTETALDGFPVLDLGEYLATGGLRARETLTGQVRHALENVGFFFIINHGVPTWMTRALFAEAARYFALPLEEKMRQELSPSRTGYLAMKTSTIRSSDLYKAAKMNLVESFFMKRERSPHDPDVINNKPHRGLNRWPENLPGFRETLIQYFYTVEALGKRMLPLYALAADAEADAFDTGFREPQMTLRLSHYPPVEPEPDQFGIAPHTDGGFLTLLPQSEVDGLWIRPEGKEWMKAPKIPGSFLVNSGDMLRRWTNDRFLSTPHRVLNESGLERYAAPVFFDPNTDHLIEALPSCVPAGEEPKHPPVTYEDYLAWFMGVNHQKPGGERPKP